MATSIVGRPAGRSVTGIAIAVYGGFILTGVVTTLLGPVLPILSSQWFLTDAQAGRLFTAQFAGSLLGVGLTSWLLPRFGHRAGLVLGYLFMAAGIGGLGLDVASFGMASVFGYGIGQGLTIPASNLLISDWNPQRRASALNVLNFTWGLGAVACPLFIAYANQTHTIWSSLLGLAAALALTAFAAMLTPFTPLQPGTDAKKEISWSEWHKMFASILGLLFFLYVGTETALGGWVASHAKRTESSGTHLWMFTPSMFWGSLVLGRGLAPAFLRRISQKKLVLLDLMTATTGVVILLVSRSVVGVAIGSGVAGFGLSSVFPINVALLSSFGPLASRAAGPIFACSSVGGAVIPWLVGVTSAGLGSLRIALVSPLLAIVLMLALHNLRMVHEEPSTL